MGGRLGKQTCCLSCLSSPLLLALTLADDQHAAKPVWSILFSWFSTDQTKIQFNSFNVGIFVAFVVVVVVRILMPSFIVCIQEIVVMLSTKTKKKKA